MSNTAVIILITFLGLLVGFLLTGNAEAGEPSGSFYQWTETNGAIAFAGAASQIPTIYLEEAVQHRFD